MARRHSPPNGIAALYWHRAARCPPQMEAGRHHTRPVHDLVLRKGRTGRVHHRALQDAPSPERSLAVRSPSYRRHCHCSYHRRILILSSPRVDDRSPYHAHRATLAQVYGTRDRTAARRLQSRHIVCQSWPHARMQRRATLRAQYEPTRRRAYAQVSPSNGASMSEDPPIERHRLLLPTSRESPSQVCHSTGHQCRHRRRGCASRSSHHT